jgi:spore coat protein B
LKNSTSVDKVSGLKGQWIKINLGGPESRAGKLLTVKKDYLAIQTKQDEVIYYQLDHIKGVSINANNYWITSRKVKHLDEECFWDVLKHYKHKKVKINRGGPESIEGVMNDIFKNHIELTVGDEIVFLSIWHLKSISAAETAKHRSSGKKSSGKKSSGKKSSSKKSSDKKSSGKKSSGQKKHSSGKKRSSGCDVREAVREAKHSGNDKYMHNDPYGSSGKKSDKKCSTKRSRSGDKRKRTATSL